jgi:CHASE2 domain-containing sensor protein
MARGGRISGRALAIVIAGLVAAGAAGAADLTRLLPGLEQESIAQRFETRGEAQAGGVLLVAIDDKTFADTHMQWPFPRRVHGKAIDRLRAAGAKAIVYDVQFTEPTNRRDDNALAQAVGRAGNVILATAETDEHGRSNVLGGDENLRRLHARPAASNLPAGPGGALQRFERASGGLDTMAVATAKLVGRAPAPSAFHSGGAWIDFRGPPGTIDTVSFSDLVDGRVAPSRVRGRIVVVGATAPTLQDVHPTPTSGERLMAGPEIEANAIWTAVHGLPLRSVPRWVDLLLIFGLGLLPVLASLRLRALLAALLAPAVALAYLLVAQLLFDSGWVAPVAAPLAALGLGTVGTVGAGYLAESRQRRRVSLLNEVLEEAVRERTAELRETQLEVIHRLAQATESRDEETGLHLERMSHLCHALGRALGMTEDEAEVLRTASLLHDVGKIAVPDAVLSKPGRLDDEEWAVMRRHTALGASILAGSKSLLMQTAEEIARTHHERWDGSGYPAGLVGEQIPLAGRICAVCDVFDALLSRRPYKEPWPLDKALLELRRQRGRDFDPVVVDAFMGIVDGLDPSLLAPEGPAVEPEREPAIA